MPIEFKSTVDRPPEALTRTALYDESSAVLITFDAVLSEQHALDSDISEFPAEEGVPFSDMQVVKPAMVTLSTVITNHPIEPIDLTNLKMYGAALAAKLPSELTPSVAVPGTSREIPVQNRGAPVGAGLAILAQFLNNDPEERKDIEAFQIVRTLQQYSTRLLIVTPFVQYRNMLLKSINIRKDKDSVSSLVADLVFREVQIFSTQSRKIKITAKTKELTDKNTPKTSGGTKNPKEATPAQETKVNKGFTASLWDFIFG